MVILGFTARPVWAPKEKPKVSVFAESRSDDIEGLEPDLVVDFSDI